MAFIMFLEIKYYYGENNLYNFFNDRIITIFIVI